MSGESYSGALEAAGATVHECRWFGSYQGEWVADVTLPDGRRGTITGYFGSCSGCDAFESELGYDSHQWEDHPDDEGFKADCEKCVEYQSRLKKFGEDYFESLCPPEALVEGFVNDRWWSSYNEERERAQFVLSLLTPGSPEHTALTERLAQPDSLDD